MKGRDRHTLEKEKEIIEHDVQLDIFNRIIDAAEELVFNADKESMKNFRLGWKGIDINVSRDSVIASFVDFDFDYDTSLADIYKEAEI